MPPRLTCYSEVNKMAVKKTLTFKIEVSISGFDEYPDQTRELFKLSNALDNSIGLDPNVIHSIGVSKYVEDYGGA